MLATPERPAEGRCCAAFLVQLEGGFTKGFHETLKPKEKVPL